MAGSIRVAIIGGGIGGCTMANGLMKHPHIEFDVFEASSAFKEQGQAVGISGNALRALRRISPDLIDSLRKAGGVPTKYARFYMGEGPDRGAFVCDLTDSNDSEGSFVVHRALFLKELLKGVPDSRLHVNKKLARIDQHPSTEILTVHFEDGTSSQYHAVIGSDGIRSTVRKEVLIDHPELVEPHFAHFWDVRTAVPIEVARKAGVIGESDWPEVAWIGDGGYFLYQTMNDGELLGCIVAGIADENYDGSKWRNTVDREFLAKALRNWGQFGESILSVMLEHPDSETFAFSQYESATAPTYSNGTVCVMGDAAHAMTPWQGSGAGTSIEDVMILELLLGKVTQPSQISAALKAYDEVRRPRTQRVVETSREVGIMSCGRHPAVGLDLEKLSQELAPTWDHITNLDMEEHISEALTGFDRLNSK